MWFLKKKHLYLSHFSTAQKSVLIRFIRGLIEKVKNSV